MKIEFTPTLKMWLHEMEVRNHAVFENDSKPYNLNICGWRTARPELDEFKDWISYAWKYEGEWEWRLWPATTLPGSHYLRRRLLNPKGTAILVPGQYRGVYKLDLHNGKYEALCQRLGPVSVYRDGNRDEVFDYEPSSKMSGMFGINIHRASWSGKTAAVNKHSAGCQVFQVAADHKESIELAHKGAFQFGNKFSYTLLQR